MSINQIFTGAISGNNVAVYNGTLIGSQVSFVGEIVKVDFIRGDARAAGSVFLYESGTTLELVWSKVNNLQTNSTHYPVTYPEDNTGLIISGLNTVSGAVGTLFRRVVNAPLYIVGSGWGSAGSSISGLYITLNNTQ